MKICLGRRGKGNFCNNSHPLTYVQYVYVLCFFCCCVKVLIGRDMSVTWLAVGLVFVVNILISDLIEAYESKNVLSQSSQVDNRDEIDTFSQSERVRDDVACTIGDAASAREALCPSQCRCSPARGQKVLTTLTVNCSGVAFNQSTASQFDEDIAGLLSQCVSELVELSVTNTPLSAIPSVVCQLDKMRSLNLNGNRLASLPGNCFTRMRNLTSFSASDNRLTSLQVRRDVTMSSLGEIQGQIQEFAKGGRSLPFPSSPLLLSLSPLPSLPPF